MCILIYYVRDANFNLLFLCVSSCKASCLDLVGATEFDVGFVCRIVLAQSVTFHMFVAATK